MWQRRGRRYGFGMKPEDEEMADAELWWEWNQRHLPLQAAKFLNYFLGVFGINRFQTGQPLIGSILLVTNFSALILANTSDTPIVWVVLPIYFYEWITLKKRTFAYNRRLWNQLVAKWNPDTKLTQPLGT